MQLFTPISSIFYFTEAQSGTALLISQSATVGTQTVTMDAKNLSEYQRLLKAQSVLRLNPVSAQTLTQLLKANQESRELTILHPSSCFDSTIYHYLLQSIPVGQMQVRAFSLNAYGHPLGELVRRIDRFHNQHNLSYDQLQLLCEQINKLSRVFLISGRSPQLEPTTTKLQRWIANLIANYAIYEASEQGWQRRNTADLKRAIAESLRADSLLWVDSCRSDVFDKMLLKQLSQWGIRDPNFIHRGQLNLCDAALPDRFTLLTLAPNKKRLAQLCDWVVQTV